MEEVRNLRVRNQHGQEMINKPVQSIAIEDDLTEEEIIKLKVDLLRELQGKIAEEKKIAKDRLADMERENKNLIDEITEYAKEHDLKVVSGRSSVVEFTPSTSREIDPESFLRFLKNKGLSKEFFDYVKVGVGAATKNFGEKVLLKNGCLTINSKDYSNIKLYTKSLN